MLNPSSPSYFMQTGFAMLCAGSIRAKNVKNVILWNLLDSCGGGLAWWSIGYALAYGGDDPEDDSMTMAGNKGFFLKGDDIRLENWFFQFAFACKQTRLGCSTLCGVKPDPVSDELLLFSFTQVRFLRLSPELSRSVLK